MAELMKISEVIEAARATLDCGEYENALEELERDATTYNWDIADGLEG